MIRYFVFLIAYLLGTIPSAFLAGKLRGIDIRRLGSGNLGATNTYRIMGKGWGLAVLFVDAAKGGLASALCLYYFGPWGAVAGAILAMLGHSFNPIFGFKPSGKGVACGFGIIIVLMPKVAVVIAAVFLLVVLISRYVSLGSVFATLALLVMVFVFQEPGAYKLYALIAVMLVLIRHRTNIKRILAKTEPKFGEKEDGE